MSLFARNFCNLSDNRLRRTRTFLATSFRGLAHAYLLWHASATGTRYSAIFPCRALQSKLQSKLQSMDINELLASPEGKTLEFKRDISSPDGIIRSVVAFANTAGGTIIIGVKIARDGCAGSRTPY